MSEHVIRRAVVPGSYDPVTNGHVDVIARAAVLYDEVVVAILHNPAKEGTFTVAERIGFLEDVVAGLPTGADNVRVEAFAGRLLVDVCRDLEAQVVVKGLRGGTDFAYEVPMALMNRHLNGLETLFLPGDPSLEHVSSSLVKEVVRYGGDVRGLVPDTVLDALLARLRGD
ncbi:MAG TPA: pantetheine-phosphate adenylyltransferase [Phycicoccus elongatus]|uniref:pantetheine-phosphate adenylyltransferase n=1 Tax=Phycicoccus TaxID=367298 RepID=UPI001E14075D|nr:MULTISPECIES: pantetheine-phosphate adenylyltransferase [Phycicoccus]MBK8730257.1 pantetheine-phosphate adenylyltransferase [Tetrasphaera sp.]MCB1238363.1 pantetheine-phosphate adenylyltransferase [Tetrasphaera sp.]MCB9405973.1 pantetheine-phosphate adenylyltransferase [Tetrasphaera sp.]MCO5303614.1 pantetheine-phosphate adenylyltransferase [Phycicoccus sp.]HPF76555.1 pantetheine-phosphate adenylyltransferase [Phycicoccus elongatus]